MDFFGTAGRDSIVGTIDADVIDVSQGARDTVDGGAGQGRDGDGGDQQ